MCHVRKLILPLIITLFFVVGASAQVRIAVFPFQNGNGNLDQNIWCYDLQDSLIKALAAEDPASEYFYIVPVDSLEELLAELNLDPNNPQYVSDMWKVAKQLNIKKVIIGNFNIRAERFLINAYIYDVRTKLAHPRFQAKDIFKKEETLFECIPIIVRELFPYFKR